MSGSDVVIPPASGSLLTDRVWEAPSQDAQAPAWGFESCSHNQVQHVEHRRKTNRKLSCSPWPQGSLQWSESADRGCWYPTQILDGLLTLAWERLVIRVRLPRAPKNIHTFTIAKAIEQGELEHVFAQDCVKFLAKLLTQDTPVSLQAPCWIRLVEMPMAQDTTSNKCAGAWAVASRTGFGPVKFFSLTSEEEAKCFFDALSGTRVMFNPQAGEVAARGPHDARRTVRRAYYTRGAASELKGRWLVAAELGFGNIKFYTFATMEDALGFTDCAFSIEARICVDPQGKEVRRSGINALAHQTVLRALAAVNLSE